MQSPREATGSDMATPNDRPGGYKGALVAELWAYPRLCVALFGVQFLTPEGRLRYGTSGIQEDMMPALEEAQAAGLLLHNRVLVSDEGPVLMQYWRSYEDLDQWARRLPHMRWWRWLVDNAGPDLGFYHEIYQAKAAEAIYTGDCRLAGPAVFAPTSQVAMGEGWSKDRQARFEAAAQAAGSR